MKTKRVTLGVLAFVIAIGSAFGTMSPPQTAWIKVMFLGSQAYICINTGLECDQNGPVVCKIDVLTVAGIVTVAAKRNISCASTVTSNSNIPVGLYFPPYNTILQAQ